MKRKDATLFAIIIVIVIVLSTVMLILFGKLTFGSKDLRKETELGAITQTADDYDETLEYVQQFDEIIETSEPVFVDIENMNAVFDLLTLQAIEDLDKELSKFLYSKGYDNESHYTFIINTASIVYDKSYPYFEMSLKNPKEGTTVTIMTSYKLPEYKWEFDFK